ncbi:MAG: hypothetical protein SFW07_04560 [Gammaproteobacteria bacterium]|nr:hypothetical protein [Gammaproteobacteria bacterium]
MQESSNSPADEPSPKSKFSFKFSAGPYLHKLRESAKQASSAMRTAVTNFLPPAQEKQKKEVGDEKTVDALDLSQAEKKDETVIVTAAKNIEQISVERASAQEVTAAVVPEVSVIESKAKKYFSAVADFLVPPQRSRTQKNIQQEGVLSLNPDFDENRPLLQETQKSLAESSYESFPSLASVSDPEDRANDEEFQETAAPPSFFSRVTKTFNQVKSSKPFDAVTNWVKNIAPAKKTPRIVLPPHWSDDFVESVVESKPDAFGYFVQPVTWNYGEIDNELSRLNENIAEQSAFFATRLLDFTERLDEHVNKTYHSQRPSPNTLLSNIAKGILGKPDYFLKDNIENLVESYASGNEEDRSAVVKKAAARWWNWGPLKFIPPISGFYQKLKDNTERYFTSPDVARDDLMNSIESYRVEDVHKKFNYYCACIGDFITKNEINNVFAPHEEINKLSEQVNDLEEFRRLKRVIDEHEVMLNDEERKQDHMSLDDQLKMLMNQAEECAERIKEKRNIIVPRITRKQLDSSSKVETVDEVDAGITKRYSKKIGSHDVLSSMVTQDELVSMFGEDLAGPSVPTSAVRATAGLK